MTPSFTMQPATAPTLLMRNTSRTVARPLLNFLEDGLQQAGHGALDLVHQLIDDGLLIPDIDFFLLR